MREIKKRFEQIIHIELTFAQAITFLLIGYIFAYYKIITTYYLGNDDLGRKFTGYHGWFSWGRWVNALCSNVLHTSIFLYDIAPLTQFLGCVIMAGTSILAVSIFFGKKYNLIALIISLMIGINPFFINCFQYKYDIPYMSLSVFASIFPVYYWKYLRKKDYSYIIVSFICLILMFTSYQHSAGIYPLIVMTAVLSYICEKKNIKEIARFAAYSVVSFFISALFFTLLLPKGREDSGEWAMVSSLSELAGNYAAHYNELYQNMRLLWIIVLGLVVLFGVISTVIIHRVRIAPYLLIYFAMFSFIAFGANLYIDVRQTLSARYMYGFFVGLSFAMLLFLREFLNEDSEVKRVFVEVGFVLSSIFIVYCFTAFIFIYGNILEDQYRYAEFRIKEVAYDLTDLDIMQNDEEKKVKIIGNIGLSQANRNIPDKTIAEKLLPSFFRGNTTWGEFYFRNYLDIPNMSELEDDIKDPDKEGYILAHESSYHLIYTKGNNIVIVLKNPNQ